MNALVGVCLVWMCAWGAVAQQQQQPELQRRSPVEQQAKREAVPAPPPQLKAPSNLETARAANANLIYGALRGRSVGAAGFTVKNLSLKRDAGVFTFSDGT